LVKPRHFAGHLVGELNSSIEKAPGLAAAFCPYGQPFDLLWVRETWQAATGSRRDARILTCPRPDTGWVEYAATCDDPPPRWRPSIHMPRWASRLLLEITGVRVERLNDIGVSDAIAEGYDGSNPSPVDPSIKWYADLWESINGAGSWTQNPWVWVVEFRRVLSDVARKTEASPTDSPQLSGFCL